MFTVTMLARCGAANMIPGTNKYDTNTIHNAGHVEYAMCPPHIFLHVLEFNNALAAIVCLT